MGQVTGIGGLFFRSKDPQALAEWYRTHLGVAAGHDQIWNQQAGMTVFAPFKEDSDYFPADRRYMLNLRVEGLEAMLERLRAAGIEVRIDSDWSDTPYGSFARIHDPEGNPIELWEPPAAEANA
jgi:glyoxylase I family protein